MEREYVKHTVIEMDETMIQHCILCGAVISDYRNATYPEGQPAPSGFAAGNVFVSKGNPIITTISLAGNQKFKNCS